MLHFPDPFQILYQTGTTYYKIDVAGVSPKVATATVEVTIGNVTGDVTATLSIEA